MRNKRAKDVVREILSRADVVIGGHRPWDIRVVNDEFYTRVLDEGCRAAGEAYVDGWWDAPRLDQFFHRIFLSNLDRTMTDGLRTKFEVLCARLFRRSEGRQARREAEARREPGSDLYQAMLGKRMTSTCAYWKGASTLDEAEEAKLELVCRKLELKPGMTVLEYGCGWGAFAKYAAERYGVQVLGVNGSEEPVRLGRALCRGLPVELAVRDYREVRGKFDRVVSIGILEHVGPREYRAYLENAARCLKDDGVAFLHTIGQNVTGCRCDPWFDQHVFPNGTTPSLRQLASAMEGLFVLEDCHNIGPQYDPTLMAWHGNLEKAWPTLREKYDERLRRTMKYYLLSAAGAFRSRRSQVFQFVMTKPGRPQPNCRVDLSPSPSAAATPAEPAPRPELA